MEIEDIVYIFYSEHYSEGNLWVKSKEQCSLILREVFPEHVIQQLIRAG